jgi:hypothetical protein
MVVAKMLLGKDETALYLGENTFDNVSLIVVSEPEASVVGLHEVDEFVDVVTALLKLRVDIDLLPNADVPVVGENKDVEITDALGVGFILGFHQSVKTAQSLDRLRCILSVSV